ncbi:MAG: hypothetical protein ACYTHJ_11035 [Planctomycetota bacterium]|jgi:hypothetical protein
MAANTRWPVSYLVPRGGEFELIAASDRDELRLVRTELEILKQIRVCLASPERHPGRPESRVFAEPDLDELAGIYRDACSNAVDEGIAFIDEEFNDAGKDIIMSAVNNEAEKIAEEVLASGVEALTDNGGTDAAPDTGTAATVGEEDAAEVPAVDAVDGEQTEDECADEESTATGPCAHASVKGSAAAGFDENEPVESEDSEHDVSFTVLEIEDALDTAESDISDAMDLLQEISADSASGDVEAEVAAEQESRRKSQNHGIDVGGGEHDVTGDRAQMGADHDESATGELAPDTFAPDYLEPGESMAISQSIGDHECGEQLSPTPRPETITTVVEIPPGACDPVTEAGELATSTSAITQIESGIRTLSESLSREVSNQWREAHGALNEAQRAKQIMERNLSQSREILEDLMRIRQEIEAVRAEADHARQEARMHRQEAERARQRCESSARSAEIAADHALQEAAASRMGPS